MKRMPGLIVFCLSMLLSLTARGTAQVGDRLIYNGDTVALYSNPLEQYKHADSLRRWWFGEEKHYMNTACWRGYVAEWRIIDDKLYLSNIFTCNFDDDSTKADLSKFFPLTKEGYVSADWFSGTLYLPEGKLIHYVHGGYASIFEFEKMLVFEKGNLTHSYVNDNSKSFISPYEENFQLLKEFLYSNIQWEHLPDPEDSAIKVWLTIISGDSPGNFTVELAKGADNAVFNEEALRVVRKLPLWSTYYYHGKCENRVYNLPVIFDGKNKSFYSKE